MAHADDTWNTLITRTSQLLDEAIGAGRNRVVC
jgi:hypothetical protein